VGLIFSCLNRPRIDVYDEQKKMKEDEEIPMLVQPNFEHPTIANKTFRVDEFYELPQGDGAFMQITYFDKNRTKIVKKLTLRAP